MNIHENNNIAKDWALIATNAKQRLLFCFMIDENGNPFLICDDRIDKKDIIQTCKDCAGNLNVVKHEEIIVKRPINLNLN